MKMITFKFYYDNYNDLHVTRYRRVIIILSRFNHFFLYYLLKFQVCVLNHGVWVKL